MAKVKLDIGAEIDTLSKAELDDSLKQYRIEGDSLTQGALRGIKYYRPALLQGTASTGTLALGTLGAQVGPNSGFVWSLKRAYVNGLGTADLAQIYRNGQPVWQFSGSVGQNQAAWGHLSMLFREGETISLIGVGSLVSTSVITLNCDLVEVPSQMIGKLA